MNGSQQSGAHFVQALACRKCRFHGRFEIAHLMRWQPCLAQRRASQLRLAAAQVGVHTQQIVVPHMRITLLQLLEQDRALPPRRAVHGHLYLHSKVQGVVRFDIHSLGDCVARNLVMALLLVVGGEVVEPDCVVRKLQKNTLQEADGRGAIALGAGDKC